MKDQDAIQNEIDNREFEAVKMLEAAAVSKASFEDGGPYNMQIARALNCIVRAQALRWALGEE